MSARITCHDLSANPPALTTGKPIYVILLDKSTSREYGIDVDGHRNVWDTVRDVIDRDVQEIKYQNNGVSKGQLWDGLQVKENDVISIKTSLRTQVRHSPKTIHVLIYQL